MEKIQVECSGAGETDIVRYFSRAVASRTPLSASLELTHRCNFRCVHCYLGDQKAIHRHQHRELDTDTILGLLDEMVEVGTLFLNITGGDPTIRADFIDIYQHAVRIGLLVTVFCNGSLITDEIVDTFVRYPPRVVEVTLYGATPETFEKVTQKVGSYTACMEGIALLQRAKVRLRLKTIVMTLNVDEFQDIRQLALDMNLPFRHDCSVHAALPNDDNDGRTNLRGVVSNLQDTLQVRLSPEQAAAVDMSVDEVGCRLAELADIPDAGEQSGKLYPCGAGNSSYHINPYGKLQPCLIIQSHCIDLYPKGKGIRKGWDRILKEFSTCSASDSFLCNNCENRPLCPACPGAFTLTTGQPEQVDHFYCLYIKNRRKIIANQQV